LGSLLPNITLDEGNPMKLLKNVALAAVIAASIGFVGACADQVPATTTTTTEYSTTAPAPVYVAPPITTSSSTTTTQYPNGTVTSTTPVYSSVVANPPVVMVPSSAPVVMMAPTAVQVPAPGCNGASPEPNDHFHELGKRDHSAKENYTICRRFGAEPDHDYVERKWGRTVSDHYDQ